MSQGRVVRRQLQKGRRSHPHPPSPVLWGTAPPVASSWGTGHPHTVTYASTDCLMFQTVSPNYLQLFRVRGKSNIGVWKWMYAWENVSINFSFAFIHNKLSEKAIDRMRKINIQLYQSGSVLLNSTFPPSPHIHSSLHTESHVKFAKGAARRGRCLLTILTQSTMSRWRRPRCAPSAVPRSPALMTSWTTLISLTSPSTVRCGYRRTWGCVCGKEDFKYAESSQGIQL